MACSSPSPAEPVRQRCRTDPRRISHLRFYTPQAQVFHAIVKGLQQRLQQGHVEKTHHPNHPWQSCKVKVKENSSLNFLSLYIHLMLILSSARIFQSLPPKHMIEWTGESYMWQMFKMAWMFQLAIDLRTMANHRWQKADDNWKVWTSSCTDFDLVIPNLPHSTSNLATKWACQVGSNSLQWSLKLKMLMRKKKHPRSINKCNSSHW